mmetsp:Transcript_7983/g.28494  ORF Transcript_7983/g.28494 Transcript_7983/m.28494 type:complete len:266 (-) Transcript_7983:1319-2116(-)
MSCSRVNGSMWSSSSPDPSPAAASPASPASPPAPPAAAPSLTAPSRPSSSSSSRPDRRFVGVSNATARPSTEPVRALATGPGIHVSWCDGSTARSTAPVRTRRKAMCMSGAMYRSFSRKGTTPRTSECTDSMGTVERSGRRKSMAWHAASSSIASTRSTFSTTCSALRAAKAPMLTWSSCAPDVEMESHEAGCTSVRFSTTSAAAVHCGIMKPLLRPHSFTRKGGIFASRSSEPSGGRGADRSALMRRSMRRSEMVASSETAIAR